MRECEVVRVLAVLISIDNIIMHGANMHFKHIRGRSVASVASCTSCIYIRPHLCVA